MKTLKTITALILAVLVGTGCLTGCSTTSSQEQENLTAETQQTTAPAEQEQTTPPTQTETPTVPAGETKTVWVMSKQISYHAAGWKESFIEYSYDEKGFQNGGQRYYANGELIGDIDYYTYTIEGNVVTRYLVDIYDGSTSAAVHQFTFDDDGILRHVYLDNTGLDIRIRDWALNYDENGKLMSIDQYQDNFQHQDAPVSTRKIEVDENNQLIGYGDTRITLDENGRPICYMEIDPKTGNCDQEFYFCYEYMPIEVPAEYAAMAQALADFFEPIYD